MHFLKALQPCYKIQNLLKQVPCNFDNAVFRIIVFLEQNKRAVFN